MMKESRCTRVHIEGVNMRCRTRHNTEVVYTIERCYYQLGREKRGRRLELEEGRRKKEGGLIFVDREGGRRMDAFKILLSDRNRR